MKISIQLVEILLSKFYAVIVQALMAETNQIRAVMAAIQQRQEQLQRQMDALEARAPPAPEPRKFKLL